MKLNNHQVSRYSLACHFSIISVQISVRNDGLEKLRRFTCIMEGNVEGAKEVVIEYESKLHSILSQ